jgi:tRNA threonylcarbamoyladenosine biosynthesis protein TsaB
MILALDTSTQWLSIALYDVENAVFPFEKTWRSTRRHTIELAPAIQDMLEHNTTGKDEIDAICVATGPGSFTSLRIGLAFAKGTCLAKNIPLIGIPSLDILAYTQPPSQMPLICVLQAGRKNLAACQYEFQENWVAQGEPYVITPKELSEDINTETIICGEMNAENRRIIGRKWKKAKLCSPSTSIRRAAALAEMGAKRLLEGDVDSPMTLAPIYLHTSTPIPDVD